MFQKRRKSASMRLRKSLKTDKHAGCLDELSDEQILELKKLLEFYAVMFKINEICHNMTVKE